MYSVLDLCCGCGGLSTGLKNAGFEVVCALDFDKNATATYTKNHPNTTVHCQNINSLRFYSTKPLDLLAAGFPCQPFSYAGKRKGFDDARGTVFYEVAKNIEWTKPKIVLLENVEGLVKHNNGKTIEIIGNTLNELGYVYSWQVLNAVNYDVPQKRKRLFIIGIQNELANAGMYYKFPTSNNKIITLKEALKDVPESAGLQYSEYKKRIMELVPEGGCWRDLPEEIKIEYMGKSLYSGGGKTGIARRLAWDAPSLTLLTDASQRQTERCHPSETRPLTIREYARIQTFPDNYEFTGSLSSQYKQIGNAVPVKLAEAVGKSIIDMLEKHNVN